MRVVAGVKVVTDPRLTVTELTRECRVLGAFCASGDERIPVEPIADFASQQRALSFPGEKDYTCLPLHAEESASVTDEYLAYGEDDLRGEFVVYLDADGERESMPVDEFAGTRLARRLRFWHSDFRPPELPPSYDRPVDDAEPPRRSVDPDELLADLEAYVRDETEAVRERNRERARKHTPGELYADGHDAIPSVTYQGATDGVVEFRVVPDEADDRRQDWSYYVPETYGIHQGAEVLVHAPDGSILAEAEVVDIYGLELSLDVDWTSAESRDSSRSRSRTGLPVGVRHGTKP